MLEPSVGESLGIVDLLVEPHHAGHVVEPEIGEVGLGRVQRVTVLYFRMRVWTTKCKEFSRNQPIEITVLNFLVVFVFIVVKIVEIKET